MRMRYAITILAAFLIALAGAPALFAHAKLLSSRPAAGESLTAAPDSVELNFSTRVQHKMSSIDLIGSGGRPIVLSLLEASADGKALRAELPTLDPGSYTVSWRALSADDHLISGEFSFQVGGTPTAGPVSESSTAASMDHSSMDHGAQTEESVPWPQILNRWLTYISMMVIGGGLICRKFILDAATVEESAGNGSYRPMKALFVGVSVLLVLCLVTSLSLQTYSIFHTVRLREAYSVLSETDFGAPWLIQFAAGIAVLVLMLLHPTKSDGRGAVWGWSALAAWMFIPFASSLSGHAKAASPEFGFAIVSDWIHMVAAAVWTGGLISLAVALPWVIGSFSGQPRLLHLALVIQRFNRFAIASTVVLAITGIYNTWIHVESFSALFGSLYGRVLLGKIAVTAVMVGLGGLNSFVLRPRMLSEAGQPGETSNENLFYRSVRTEAALAVAVLLLAALLAFLPPAREHVPAAAGSGRPTAGEL